MAAFAVVDLKVPNAARAICAVVRFRAFQFSSIARRVTIVTKKSQHVFSTVFKLFKPIPTKKIMSFGSLLQ